MNDKLRYLNNIQVKTTDDLMKDFINIKKKRPNATKFALYGYQIDWVKENFIITSNTKQALNITIGKELLVIFSDYRVAVFDAEAFRLIYRYDGKQFMVREKYLKNHNNLTMLYDDVLRSSIMHNRLN